MNDKLSNKIEDINRHLRLKQSSKMRREELRRLLAQKIGTFVNAEYRDQSALNLCKDNGLIGVDGSLMSMGTNYPYEITVFRSYCKCTKKNEGEKDLISDSRVFCPLYDKDKDMLQRMIENSQGSLTQETAAHKFKKDTLASLELSVAIRGIKQFKSRVILMDGGFYRFIISAPRLWEEFKQLCLNTNTLVAGVVEEVGTHSLSELMQNQLPDFMHRDYDREMLFGVLNTGEYLKIHPSINIKNGFYTCFARFSNHPQPIAIDLLNEQLAYIQDIMNLIACLTPSNSRGIPLWIDIIDREVRITKREMEILIDSVFDSDTKEIYFMANEQRRQY